MGTIVKLGVYIASHNNPLFLRLALLQIVAQDVRPDVLAIHENGHPCQTAELINRDVLRYLTAECGVQLLYNHTAEPLAHPFFHYLPLKRLVDSGRCDLYTKMDHDDIFYAGHLAELQARIVDDWRELDWVGKRRADILVLNPKEYVFRQNREFTWNPLGGMSDCFIFNNEVAEKYLEDMVARAGTNEADDYILYRYTLPEFPNGLMLDTKATACYVSHGTNTSTAHWVRQTPPELMT